MDLKKGDIIFNHAQTESILKNGKNNRIKEFARLGEPVAEKLHKEGNAYSNGLVRDNEFTKLLLLSGMKADNATYEEFENRISGMVNYKVPDNGSKSALSSINNNTSTASTVYQFNGDLSFPNITNGDDAKKLMNELQHISAGCLQRANRH